MFNRLILVTGNENKLREARQILGIDIAQGKAKELHEIQTISVAEAVRHKAEEAYEQLKTPLLVEDSGLVINVWNGLPGALIKWFEEAVHNEGILKMLGDEKDRRAVAQCYVALHNGKEVKVACGEVPGSIAFKPSGDTGFGWDSIFIPDGYEITYAEMPSEKKNSISHRKKALDAMKKIIEAEP
ncbi:MAG: RdgB/HAM1 family non-canonical purine NTP pyrophosphatase [Nitrospinota bacterium]|nr:RdgB/HAM1 family non-canonical purine NTP pyrophosphatase [Nitrospinota bacterium]